MENIGLCKRDMAVLPQREALAASPFASLAFAQAILERNNTATGLYTPLHLIYAPEEAQAETPAPKVEVDLHLTLPAEKQSKAKQEAPGERVVESMTERMVERILRERFTMERSVIRQAAPTIQNFYHTSVRAALARREVFLQGPVAQAKAMAEVAAARQKAPEPAQLRYAQVLRRNQEAGLTASTRAPLERQAFPPARAAAPKAPPAPAGDAQAVPAQAGRGQGNRTPIAPAQAAQTGPDGASQAQPGAIPPQAGLEQGAMPPDMVAGPAVQLEPDMAPLDLRQAAFPGQARVQSAFQPAAAGSAISQTVAEEEALATGLAPAIQEKAGLVSPAAMTHRQEGAASTQPDVLPAQPVIRQAAQEGGSRTEDRQAKKARTPQAAGQPSMDASSREKAGPTATAADKAPAQKQAREPQPPTGQDIEERHRAAHPGSGQTVAAGEEAQPESADDQPVMAQRALGQEAAFAPCGGAVAIRPHPGAGPSPGARAISSAEGGSGTGKAPGQSRGSPRDGGSPDVRGGGPANGQIGSAAPHPRGSKAGCPRSGSSGAIRNPGEPSPPRSGAAPSPARPHGPGPGPAGGCHRRDADGNATGVRPHPPGRGGRGDAAALAPGLPAPGPADGPGPSPADAGGRGPGNGTGIPASGQRKEPGLYDRVPARANPGGHLAGDRGKRPIPAPAPHLCGQPAAGAAGHGLGSQGRRESRPGPSRVFGIPICTVLARVGSGFPTGQL